MTHIVVRLMESPSWIGFMGVMLIVPPIIGIAYVHRKRI